MINIKASFFNRSLKLIRSNSVSTIEFFGMRFSFFQNIPWDSIVNPKTEFIRIETFQRYSIHLFSPCSVDSYVNNSTSSIDLKLLEGLMDNSKLDILVGFRVSSSNTPNTLEQFSNSTLLLKNRFYFLLHAHKSVIRSIINRFSISRRFLKGEIETF